MLIGERIRELRQRREITQQELADALGCSRPAVVLWENGTRQTPLYQLRKISKSCNARSPSCWESRDPAMGK